MDLAKPKRGACIFLPRLFQGHNALPWPGLERDFQLLSLSNFCDSIWVIKLHMEQLLNVAACMNLKIYEISLSESFSFPKYICETKMDIFNRSESGSSYLT